MLIYGSFLVILPFKSKVSSDNQINDDEGWAIFLQIFIIFDGEIQEPKKNKQKLLMQSLRHQVPGSLKLGRLRNL